MDIIKYLEAHAVEKISENEFIVDNPTEFVNIISDSDYYIQKMIWWDHIGIKNQKQSLGGGGPIDSKDNGFMYSEIYYISKKFSANENELCRKYLLEIPKKHTGHQLIPSFSVKRKNA